MSDTTTPLAQLGYVVYPQNPTQWKDPSGAYVDAIAIRFRTPGGNIGVVNVPTADYTADRARAEVLALGEKLDGV